MTKDGSEELLTSTSSPVSFDDSVLPTFKIYSDDFGLVGNYDLIIEARLKVNPLIVTSPARQTILTIEIVDPTTLYNTDSPQE